MENISDHTVTNVNRQLRNKTVEKFKLIAKAVKMLMITLEDLQRFTSQFTCVNRTTVSQAFTFMAKWSLDYYENKT